VKHYNLEEIYSYLDGQMSPLDKKRFEDHILVCKDCALKLEKAEEFFSFVKVEEEEPPIDISSLIMEKIDRKRRILPFLYSFLSILFLMIVIPVFFGPSKAMLFYYMELKALSKIYSSAAAVFKVFSLFRTPTHLIILAVIVSLIPFLVLELRKIWRKI